jgi:hypothetical protein
MVRRSKDTLSIGKDLEHSSSLPPGLPAASCRLSDFAELVPAVYSGSCVQYLEFDMRGCALGEALAAVRGGEPKQARGLVFGVALQGSSAV